MSVPLSKRTESKLQVIVTATDIKTAIHDLCLRDFGIKDIDHIIRKKYNVIQNAKDKHERYSLELYRARDELASLSDQLLYNVRTANRQKMNSLRKCNIRLSYQEKALDLCEMIIAKSQDIVTFFAVDLKTFKPLVTLIDSEIKLIKSWITYTKKVMKIL
jgi:hypothetical protein